jgi:hypothetical protein
VYLALPCRENHDQSPFSQLTAIRKGANIK